MNLAEHLKSRLMRKTQVIPSRWAAQCMQMGEPFPGPLGYKHHPWLKEMLDSNAEVNVGMKAAQMGYSIAALAKSLYLIDIRKLSVLYLLPTKTPDATDFSTTRFDPLLEASPHLQTLFSDVRNVGAKRAGLATLYIRGSNSRSGLKSIPVSAIFFDELDEMVAKNIPLARQRTAGQRERIEWYISTPTAPGHGIDAEWLKSNQQHFHFRCPSCSRMIRLVFDNLIIPDEDPDLAFLKCLECDNALTVPGETQEQLTARKAEWYDEGKNCEWVPSNSQAAVGWNVNQAYSCAVSGNPKDLAEGYLETDSSKAKEQEYWTSRWAQAHEVEGARVAKETVLDIARKCGYRMYTSVTPNYIITMGVDVGGKLHCVVKQWTPIPEARTNDKNLAAKAKILFAGTRTMTPGCTELDELMRDFNVRHCVIDANPERSSAYAFAKRFWGWVHLCFFGNSISAAEMVENEERLSVTVDRTQWLDVCLGRYNAGTIELPQDISGEFVNHIHNIARRYEEDAHGNPVGRYLSNGEDHYALASCYAEIALPFASSD